MQNGTDQNAKTNVLAGSRATATLLPAAFFYRTNQLTLGVRKMGLFGKKDITQLPPLLSDAEISGASYEQVLDFLVSVNQDDFDKIVKVAGVYREAHSNVAQITGLTTENTPSIFEQVDGLVVPIGEQAKTDTEAGDFLATDDDLTAAFLDDDETPAPAADPTPAAPTAKTPGTAPKA